MGNQNILFWWILALISGGLCQSDTYDCGDRNMFLNTSQGALCGVIASSRTGRFYTIYHNIPYALPPTGPRRLMPPVPANKWEGVLNATQDIFTSCLQRSKYQDEVYIIGREDCLYCSVYTPKGARDTSSLLPVMIIIMGQVYKTVDAATYYNDPQYMMDENVLMVNFNHRLGPLGFLSLEDQAIPGNYGLKDQACLLDWVQKYISDYGGDPNRVTLWGQGAGGIAAGLHVCSPLSKNLFRRLITESGNPLSFPAVNHPGIVKQRTERFARSVGCYYNNSYEILKCFKTLTAERFLNYHDLREDLGTELIRNATYFMEPVIESNDVSDRFLDCNPWTCISQPNNKEWLTGTNSADGDEVTNNAFTFSRPDKIQPIDDNSMAFFPTFLGYLYTIPDSEQRAHATRTIKEYYFHGNRLRDSYQNFTIMIRDRLHLTPVLDLAYFYNYTSESRNPYDTKLYLYNFDYRNKYYSYNASYGTMNTNFGSSHGDELIEFIRMTYDRTLNGTDYVVSRTIVKMWVNFATFGDPTPDKNFDNYQYYPVWQTSGFRRCMFIRRDGSFEMNFLDTNGISELWSNLGIGHYF